MQIFSPEALLKFVLFNYRHIQVLCTFLGFHTRHFAFHQGFLLYDFARINDVQPRMLG